MGWQCADRSLGFRCSIPVPRNSHTVVQKFPNDVCKIIGRDAGTTGVLCETHSKIDRCSLRFHDKCEGSAVSWWAGKQHTMNGLMPWQCRVAGVSEHLVGTIDQVDGISHARVCRDCWRKARPFKENVTDKANPASAAAPRRRAQPSRKVVRPAPVPDETAVAAETQLEARQQRLVDKLAEETTIEGTTSSGVRFAADAHGVAPGIRSMFYPKDGRLFVVLNVRRGKSTARKWYPVAALSYMIGRTIVNIEGAFTRTKFRRKGMFQRLHDYALKLCYANARIRSCLVTALSPWVQRDCLFLGYTITTAQQLVYDCRMSGVQNVKARLDIEVRDKARAERKEEERQEEERAAASRAAAASQAAAASRAAAAALVLAPAPALTPALVHSTRSLLDMSRSRAQDTQIEVLVAYEYPGERRLAPPPAGQDAQSPNGKSMDADNDSDPGPDFTIAAPQAAHNPNDKTIDAETDEQPQRARQRMSMKPSKKCGAEAPTKKPKKTDRTGLHNKKKSVLLQKLQALKDVSRFTSAATSRQARKRQYPAYAKAFLAYAHNDHKLAQTTVAGVQSALIVMEEAAKTADLKAYKLSFTDIITGKQRKKSHTMCSGCWKYIPRHNYHDYRTCTEREQRLDAQAMVQLTVRLHFSRNTRTMLRKVLGLQAATEQAFLQRREEIHDTIPPLSACDDNVSVRSNVHDMVEWYLQLPHIRARLNKLHKVLVTMITNDGTPQRGKKGFRPLHPTLFRCGNIGRAAQSLDETLLLFLHEKSESTETFWDMFVCDKVVRESIIKHLSSTYGWEKHLCLLIADGAALAHHVNTNGSIGTYGCTHCTRHMDLKHIVKRHCIEPVLKRSLGETRTFKKIKEWTDELQEATLIEMERQKTYYMECVDNDKAEYESWLMPNKLHHAGHIAHKYILEYSRKHCFSTRGLPTFWTTEFDERNIIFDALHGMLNCVKKQCLGVLRDVVANNEGLVLESMEDVFAGYSELQCLWLPLSDNEDVTKKDALEGNGCQQLLNAWEDIITRLFGEPPADDTVCDGAANEKYNATLKNNSAYDQLADEAEVRREKLQKKREKEDGLLSEETNDEKVARALYHMYRSQVEKIPEAEKKLRAAEKAPAVVRVTKSGAKRPGKRAAPAPTTLKGKKVKKYNKLQHQRQQCAKYLLPLGICLRNSLAILFMMEVREGVNYEEVIDTYELEIEAYNKHVLNITARNLCVNMSKEQGSDLSNWPLHSMVRQRLHLLLCMRLLAQPIQFDRCVCKPQVDHVADMMRFIWRTSDGACTFGLTVLKVTEKFNSILKTAAVHTKKLRGITKTVLSEKAKQVHLRQLQHYQIARDVRLMVAMARLSTHPDLKTWVKESKMVSLQMNDTVTTATGVKLNIGFNKSTAQLVMSETVCHVCKPEPGPAHEPEPASEPAPSMSPSRSPARKKTKNSC